MNSNPVESAKTGLLGKDCAAVDESVLDCPLVAFYFSAHWCPPCRNFTPVLAEWYKEQNASGKQIEIVFVTCDRDDAGFKSYFAEMPWVSLPFGDSRAGTFKSEMGCQGIPHLVIYKKDGTLVTKAGRNEMSGDPSGCIKKWMA